MLKKIVLDQRFRDAYSVEDIHNCFIKIRSEARDAESYIIDLKRIIAEHHTWMLIAKQLSSYTKSELYYHLSYVSNIVQTARLFLIRCLLACLDKHQSPVFYKQKIELLYELIVGESSWERTI